MWTKKWRIAAAAGFVLFFALAATGFELFIVMRNADQPRLARLIVPTPPAGYTHKPSASNVVTAADNPFSSFQSNAKRSPAESGAYSVTWVNPASSNDSASILLSYLPSASAAEKVQAQAVQQFTGTNSFKAQNYAFYRTVPVSGIPGARAAAFTATGKTTTPPVVAVVFSTGRAQVLELVGQTGTPQSTAAVAVDLARSQFLHLRRALPAFSLGVTRFPTVATSVYWAVAVAIAALALGVPLGIRRARRLRDERRRRAAERQHQVRGSKIARRQAARRR
jgi:hypothetical protein